MPRGTGGEIKLDETLAIIFEKDAGEIMTGMELVKGLWAYIRKHDLKV